MPSRRSRVVTARLAGAATLAALVLSQAPLVVPAVAASPSAVVPEAVAAAGWCGIAWGSLPKVSVGSQIPGTVVGVRAGRHDCFDRLVIDVRGPIAGYDVRYVDAVRTDGAGRVVPLDGAADLRIRITAPAYDQQGRATYLPADAARLVRVTGWSTFRQVAWAGSFEGSTTIGLGVRARLPMRVFVLPGGEVSRLVVDVAHRW